MASIISNFFISLDGVVESPDQWHFDYWSDEMGGVMGRGMATCTGFLMGRTLYEEWSAYWADNTDDDGFGPFIKAIPKYVVSTTLTEATWENTTLVTGSPEEIEAQLRAIRADTDGDIGISGSATLVRSLLAMGLVDTLALLMHPVVVGSGQRLFEDTAKTPLTLLSSTTIANGVLHLEYAPAGGVV
ncbi:dihydrofolate reductase family protein [Nocardioides sp.]|uniref:dihydrofolate reductase family protein n=1 Tax=Nocardioides sp. TaxID=35761 RepID=UPI00286B3341|nr:dihydrofolate reductase family protein [Nocardioides sp.]